MSKSSYFESKLLGLVFHGNAIPLIAENHNTPTGNLYLSLHTASTGEGGNQTANEATYTGYARVAVTRDPTGWNISGNVASPAVAIEFAECQAGGDTITHAAIGDLPSGAGNVLFHGALSPNLTITTGVIPRIKTTSTITEA
ncbi:hypothetical protein C8R30_101142 [Nitrosomonas nitrosa]|uniref:phage tail fiber protein n=1 Tax=Nitrosomonas nitrosa TaxID=52442 RepID=UPI000D3248DD|nr:hypothetical protein [Nitrosomonas nitrosa]PTR04945.1 hypothetical protein C8R30_101142 [Nitrosomonas nitrosa]